jgi:hypothetical protein
LFATAHRRLAFLGLRVPEIHLLDRDRAYHPADIAIVEDFPGENLQAFWDRDPVAAEPTLGRLRAGLAAMRDYRGRAPGKVSFDHVLVDADGHPVIIDIESLMYFDVEWEHAHMQVRLGRDWARTVGVDDLDQDRLALYMLAQRLFLVAGPLRLLDGDFPDRAFMRGIIEHNLHEALALLP